MIDARLSPKATLLKKILFRCGLALGVLVVPAVLTAAFKLHPALHPIISLAFVLAISAAAWWGGALAGIIATCATVPVLTLAASGGKIFLPPHVDVLGIVLFLFISLLVSRVAMNRKRIEQVLRSANAQLENRVKERTAELRFANAAIRQANVELQKSEEQFRTLANAIPQLCWMTDGAGAVLWCNDRWTLYTGTTIDQIQNSGWKTLHHPDTLPTVIETWEKSLATAEPFEMEFPLRASDGQFRWFLTRVYPVSDDAGKAARWFGTATDIDELKRSREALIESEARFRAMADSAPVMIWVSESDKTFTWFNKPWLEFTGCSIRQELDMQWSAGIHPEDKRRCVDAYISSFDARKEFVMEYRRRRRDAAWRWVLSHGVPRRGADGTFLGYIGSCIEIHDRKEMEENLRRANTDLQQFAYSASHDLQEPIRMVAIYSQLIGRKYGSRLDGNGQLFLEYLNTAAQRMEKLVRDLLFYTQTGSIDLGDSEAAGAYEVLKEVLENLSAVIAESGACVTNDSLPAVNMHAAHLQQLFQNLLGNAIKYHGDKPPSIHVSAKEQDDCWLFSVQDNGIGIDPAYKERIFGIFKRLHTNDKYSGTGIGLAICQRIVERYGGRIWVESEPGKGSTFFFTIPV
jgi:PAS domain S-box-containing protein